MPEDQAIAEARNVSVEYRSDVEERSLLVLENVSLAVAPNEVLAILGPSGCGKSTLLRTMIGLLPPTREGDVLLIANAGAYGHAMSSRYNLREPAQEFVLPPG